jgi:hypothetical protein
MLLWMFHVLMQAYGRDDTIKNLCKATQNEYLYAKANDASWFCHAFGIRRRD